MLKKIISAAVAFMMLVPAFSAAARSETDMKTIKVDCGVSATKTDENGNGYGESGDIRVYSTLKGAKEYARTLDKTDGGVVIKITGGFYYQHETLVFEPEDSNVRYEAEDPADPPVISGGYELSGAWEKDRETTNGTIYKIGLDRDKKLRSIYVNGKRAMMTKRDIEGTAASEEQYTVTPDETNSDWAWTSGTAAAGTIFPADTIPADTRNPQNVELETQTTWNKALVCVEKFEKQPDNTVMARLQQPYGIMAQLIGWAMYTPTSKNTVYNVYEWLENPGEFYFDEAGHTLYYVCAKDENINSEQVVIPETETLIEMRGVHTTDGDPMHSYVENIEFSDLDFEYTDWNLWDIAGSHGNASVQASTSFVKLGRPSWHEDIYRTYDVQPAAIKADISRNISITNCSVSNTGSLGIHFENDISDCRIEGNSVKNTGGAGIVIGHPQHVYENDPDSYKVKKGVAGADKEKFARGTESVPKNIMIDNNYLRDTCFFFPGHAPITSFYTQNMQILHNFIYGAPYSGISFGWGWNNFDGNSSATLPNIPSETSFNNKINENRIENIMTTLSDAGAIYSLGKQGKSDWTDYSEMNRNYLNFSRDPAVKRSSSKRGIHTDEGSAYIKVNQNIITNFGCVYEFNDWKRKHDVYADGNYSNETYWRSGAPSCEVTNEYYDADCIWDKTGYEVALTAGLEDDYKKMIDSDLTGDLDETLPASVCLAPSDEIRLGKTFAENDTIWLAPEGTAEFSESASMTSAKGNSGTITAPKENGEYRLYIEYADGTISAASENIVLVGSKAANVNNGEVKYVSKINPFVLKLNDKYTYTLNGVEITDGYEISTAGEWMLSAAEKSSGGIITINFITKVSDPDMLLPFNLSVKPGNTIHLSYCPSAAGKTVWIAPYATEGGFEESDTMTKASGSDSTIRVPNSLTTELYNLYVIDENGNISVSAASLSTKSESTLAPPETAAAQINSIESVNIGDSSIRMPELPDGYAAEVYSSEPSVLDRHGNFTSEYDGQNISVIFEIFRCDDNASCLSVPLITGLPPEPSAPEYIEGSWVKTAAQAQNLTNKGGSTKPKIENPNSETPDVGYVANNAYGSSDKTDSVGEVYFSYPDCSLKGLEKLSLNINGKAGGEQYVYICLDEPSIEKAIASTKFEKSSYKQYEMDVTLPEGADIESGHDLYIVFASYGDTTSKWLANIMELIGYYSYKNEDYKIMAVSGFNAGDNTTSAAITVNDDCAGVVTAAIYDKEGVCLETHSFDAKEIIRVSFAQPAECLRVFYWNDLETMMPKCEAVVVNK